MATAKQRPIIKKIKATRLRMIILVLTKILLP
jgi:hypothetical protein